MKLLSDFYITLEMTIGERVFKLIRYLTSGGSAALVNWVTLFLLVHIGVMHYLPASIFAYIISTATSFIMQKFWTFRDNKVHDIKLQMSRYLIVILFSLILNTVLIYVLVEILTIWYLTAQIIATVIIAVTNFFCYQHFVFKERTLTVNSKSVL